MPYRLLGLCRIPQGILKTLTANTHILRNKGSFLRVCALHPQGTGGENQGKRKFPRASRRARGVLGMFINQEVKVLSRGPSEGTRNRGSKGLRATEGPVEAVGRFRFERKRSAVRRLHWVSRPPATKPNIRR